MRDAGRCGGRGCPVQPFAARLVLGEPGVCRKTARAFGQADEGADENVAGLSKGAAVDCAQRGAGPARLAEGLKAAGVVAKDLAGLKGSDPRKLALAKLLWKQTTVSQEWIAEKLSMHSAANVSQQLRKMDQRKTLSKLPPEMRNFLEGIRKNGQ